jgi:hypothetical protein
MHFSHISIGGGITGLETIISAFTNIQRQLKKSKKIIFAIIDKNPENIPGGVAYGFKISQFGYFNNPIRLSPVQFTKWVIKKENKKKIISYLKIHGGYTGKDWIKKNINILYSSKIKQINELYIPRTIANFWMEQRLLWLISKMKKISKKNSIIFDLKFFKGEVLAIKNLKDNYHKIIFKNNYCEMLQYKIIKNSFKKIVFEKNKRISEPIFSKTQNIGLGLPPPKQLATTRAQKNNYYIWDFYSQGSTSDLINKILQINKIKKKIRVYFIGYKAGLLESLPELKKIILKKKIKIEIICSSKDLESIQKAKLSLNKKSYKLQVFKKKKLFNIRTAKKLYLSIMKEFELSYSLGYKKYDAWTQILNNKILDKCIKNFSYREKKQYNDFFYNKVRNATRFTYPETIIAREKLLKMKILKTKKEIVKKVDNLKGQLIVETKSNNNKINKYICDLVINVSGPLNVGTLKNEIPLINDLRKNGAKILSGGFVVNNYFKISGIKNIYTPGILARGFNPERKTIIKAILENSQKAGKSIAKTLINM